MLDSFRQRPLTWLFAVAYVCLFLAVSFFHDGADAEWAGTLLIAGLYIVGASAAIARVHRLARGAIWLAGVAAAVTILFGFEGSRFRGETLALVFIMAIAPWATATLTRGIMRVGARNETMPVPSAWRISIVEILGWMIVVAVASAGLRFADFGVLADAYQNSLWIHGAIAGALAGLFLTPERRCDRIATAVATVVVIAALFVIPEFIDDWYSQKAFLAPLYAVFGLWILVLRLDESAVATPVPLAIIAPHMDALQDE
jgi:hypothetical protein